MQRFELFLFTLSRIWACFILVSWIGASFARLYKNLGGFFAILIQ